LEVSEIAEAANISLSHLHLLFRKHLQTTPHQLVLKRRLQKAQ
jgi:AraC-like DNA-binding protein